MFDSWCDEFSAPLRRVFDPPVAVLVDLSAVITPEPGFRRDAVPMRTKNAGLDATATVPGLLHAWARTTTGAWIGFVHLGIPTGDRRGYVETRQWCPAGALTRRES